MCGLCRMCPKECGNARSRAAGLRYIRVLVSTKSTLSRPTLSSMRFTSEAKVRSSFRYTISISVCQWVTSVHFADKVTDSMSVILSRPSCKSLMQATERSGNSVVVAVGTLLRDAVVCTHESLRAFRVICRGGPLSGLLVQPERSVGCMTCRDHGGVLLHSGRVDEAAPLVNIFSSSLTVVVAIFCGDTLYVSSSVQNTGRNVLRSSHLVPTMLL